MKTLNIRFQITWTFVKSDQFPVRTERPSNRDTRVYVRYFSPYWTIFLTEQRTDGDINVPILVLHNKAYETIASLSKHLWPSVILPYLQTGALFVPIKEAWKWQCAYNTHTPSSNWFWFCLLLRVCDVFKSNINNWIWFDRWFLLSIFNYFCCDCMEVIITVQQKKSTKTHKMFVLNEWIDQDAVLSDLNGRPSVLYGCYCEIVVKV